jgi:hypothetical protein
VGTLSMEGLQRCLLQFYREIGACDNMSISRSQESSPNRSPTQTSAFEKTLGERLTPSRQKPRCSPPRSQPQYSPPKKHSPPKHSLPWQQPRYSPPRLQRRYSPPRQPRKRSSTKKISPKNISPTRISPVRPAPPRGLGTAVDPMASQEASAVEWHGGASPARGSPEGASVWRSIGAGGAGGGVDGGAGFVAAATFRQHALQTEAALASFEAALEAQRRASAEAEQRVPPPRPRTTKRVHSHAVPGWEPPSANLFVYLV